MNFQAAEQMELQEARKKGLCCPLHPVPPKKGIYMNREPGIPKSLWHHSAGVTSAYPPFIQKAKFQNPCMRLVCQDCSFSLPAVCFLLRKQGVRL